MLCYLFAAVLFLFYRYNIDRIPLYSKIVKKNRIIQGTELFVYYRSLKMSKIFCKDSRDKTHHVSVDKLLEENNQLIAIITEYQHKGLVDEVDQYQKILHRNLTFLATLADSAKCMPVALPLYSQRNQDK